MSYRIEYLITVGEKEGYCQSAETFCHLLQTLEGVTLSNNELRHASISAQLEIQTGLIPRDKQRFFHLKLTFSDDCELSEAEALLRKVRGLLSQFGGRPPQVLWDELGSRYAQAAYPIIHEIENTMRKLITKFMAINVGQGWARETVPAEVLESVRSKDARLDHNYLFEVDFIQLANILFKEYATVNAATLIDRIRKATDQSELSIDELKLAVPTSNWDRFFSSLVSCESEYLKVRWERLYEKRNKIAHNRQVSRTDFDDIRSLCQELGPKLRQAVDSLDNIFISEDAREILSESVATTKSEGYSDFLSQWQELHHQLYLLALARAQTEEEKKKINLGRHSIRALVNIAARQLGVITASERQEIKNLIAVRNYIVHQPDVLVPVETLAKYNDVVANYVTKLSLEVQRTLRGNSHSDTDGVGGEV